MNSIMKLVLFFVLVLGLNFAFGQELQPDYPVLSTRDFEPHLVGPLGGRRSVHLSRSYNGRLIWSKSFRYWGGVAIDQQGNTLFNGEELLYKISPAGKVLWTHPNEGVSLFGSDKEGNVFRIVDLDQNYHSDNYMVKIVKLSPAGKTLWVRWRSVKVQLSSGLNLTLIDGFRVTEQRLEISFGSGPILYLSHDGNRLGQTDKPTLQQWREMHGNPYEDKVDKYGAVVKVDIQRYSELGR